ncbi:GNAT family N-acetyltransferase [Streptomyces zhihengii]|uniref:GNAT family N-acetyltransferase n=1 Tax=Streptomyces zhihengii TaxID=1818004 RepID=UPI0033B277F6
MNDDGVGAVTDFAVRGDGQAVAALGALALSGAIVGRTAASQPLAAAIDEYGGRIPLPYGHGHCWVTRTGAGPVAGMLYLTPPIRWLEGHPPALRPRLSRAVAEIELLAVEPAHRRRGTGSALLQAAENAALSDGVQLMLAKVRIGALPLMRWYRRRGYLLAGQGEPIVFATQGGMSSCDDGGDGYQLAVKALQPGVTVRRTSSRGTTLLVAQRDA